jgi:phage shock protein E
MKAGFLGVVMMGALLVFSSCTGEEADSLPSSQPAPSSAYHKISAMEAMEMMESSDEYILVDVRTEAEFIEQRIEGALLIPDNQIKTEAERLIPDKDALLLVYCRSGRRSAAAAKELVQLGYTRVYDFGGILDWSYATVSGE